MSHLDLDTDQVSPYTELCRQLVLPGATAYALEPAGITGATARRVATGDPTDLIAQATAHNMNSPQWAVVAPIRAELLVVDLDHCADEVLSEVLDAAGAVSAGLAYLAASGSKDSVHVAFACPTEASRHALISSVEGFRHHYPHLGHTAIAIIPSKGPLRLPGSASLKPGGAPCRPIDEQGHTLTGVEAVRRLRYAIATAHPGEALEPRTTPPPAAATANIGRRIRTGGTVASTDDVRDVGVEQPRAWRRTPALTSEQFRILSVEPTHGYRSDAATAAAWVLWQRNIRSFAYAAPEYRRWPAFVKFVERDAQDRDRGRHLEPGYVSNCERHWRSITARARSLRPAETDPNDAELISAVLADIASWDDAALVAAALAAITYRFSDGYGTSSRPISVRDVAGWLNIASYATANALIAKLAARGLLELTIPHDQRTSARSAHCFTLRRPSVTYRTDAVHEVTERSLLHPLWGTLGHSCGSIYHHLGGTTPISTSRLSLLSGLPAGSATHGVRLRLARLESLGLAVRHGVGRGTRWSQGPARLDVVATATGATAAHGLLLTRINLDRSSWHAATYKAQAAARRQLERWRSRLSEKKSLPAQLVLTSTDWQFPSVSAHRSAPRIARTPRRTPRPGRGGPPVRGD